MFDAIKEIISTIKENKLRTILTGFAVAWGIFMLIVLLASGNGFRNGVMANFSSRAVNAVSVYPGSMSMPYKGLPAGRNIRFDFRDFNMVRDKIPEVAYLSASMGTNLTVSYGEEYVSLRANGGTSDLAHINNIKIEEGMGRFINRIDDQLRRKVMVIHPDHRKILFKDGNPVGKYLTAGNTVFQVIGVYSESQHFNSNNPPAYIPLSTAQTLYNRGYGFRNLEFTVQGLTTFEENEAFNTKLRERFGQLHGFDPADRSALYISNSAQQSIRTQNMFGIINVFLVIVGLASLMAGIVGVSNIMVITVKERTREIGIRKAIGASPAAILRLVILESVFVTTCAGYAGIVLGVGLTELAGYLLSQSGGEKGETSIFLNPTVDVSAVFLTTLLLIVCGTVAGLVPALKAVRVKPIEAMRAE
ncbi:MAG: ABC transporter permease [Bacteroidales bacterium]|jgi:putative ABC transport system permease protein|nr:ABC transporter permease [Bacteroidales bacterium]